MHGIRPMRRLLFHNIKPVFVFDGVAPAIKRRTTLLRRQRRELAGAKTKKIAEKLLLARLKCAHALPPCRCPLHGASRRMLFLQADNMASLLCCRVQLTRFYILPEFFAWP